ncbi:MAG TPA: hypothetical protein VHU40_14595 [Polyangia bacterium]|nr:hypothetical protein [Polyangia bacterium]
MGDIDIRLFDADALTQLRRSAEDAAAAGDATFGIPAAAPVVEHLAAMGEGSLRRDGEGWLASGASYHALVRLAARVVKACTGEGWPSDAVYVPKAEGELEAMLQLWPSVLVVPTALPLTSLDLVALRAYPVHPLGIVNAPSWADGRLCSPAEYFFHDLDHARFKIREDLLVEGIAIPDAYQEGTTLDARTGRHRTILDAASGRIGPTLWNKAPSRTALARRLLAYTATLDKPRAAAAELLLFEILCEKSHALEVSVLARELDSGAHVDKIRRKQASGFYGQDAPEPATMVVLDEVAMLLRKTL